MLVQAISFLGHFKFKVNLNSYLKWLLILSGLKLIFVMVIFESILCYLTHHIYIIISLAPTVTDSLCQPPHPVILHWIYTSKSNIMISFFPTVFMSHQFTWQRCLASKVFTCSQLHSTSTWLMFNPTSGMINCQCEFMKPSLIEGQLLLFFVLWFKKN